MIPFGCITPLMGSGTLATCRFVAALTHRLIHRAQPVLVHSVPICLVFALGIEATPHIPDFPEKFCSTTFSSNSRLT